MNTQRISKRMIDRLKPSTKEYAVFDSDIPGFGVRVRPSGTMSYILMYRTGHGRRAALRKFTIGLAGKLTPEQARILAKRLAGDESTESIRQQPKLKNVTIRLSGNYWIGISENMFELC